MLQPELLEEGARQMGICNACRYCEGYCAVFPAMERRLEFGRGDLSYLANLCHNCGECLYACQYAPPHAFEVNVPRTLGTIRTASYREYAWPQAFARALQSGGLAAAVRLAAAMAGAMLLATWLTAGERLFQAAPGGDFYAVMPHGVMAGGFGLVGLFVLAALLVGLVRFWRDTGEPLGALARPRPVLRALHDAFTLKNLHAAGAACTEAEEARRPLRRWFHHLTFYGFLLCFAATAVGTLYHYGFGWRAPYGYLSLPVLLGTVGGLALLAGPPGLYVLGRRRDPALADEAKPAMDASFIALLFLTSLTGLLLLALRETAAMGTLLAVHLGVVLALFLVLPYGKFVHGLYRTAALVKHAIEQSRG